MSATPPPAPPSSPPSLPPQAAGRLFVRVAAFLVDWFLIVTVTALLVEAAVHGDVNALRHHDLAIGLIGQAMAIVYFTLLEGSFWQATFAKRLLHLEVRAAQGAVGYRRALVRSLVRFLPLSVPYAGFVWPLLDALPLLRDGRALHDRAAGTVVVEREPR